MPNQDANSNEYRDLHSDEYENTAAPNGDTYPNAHLHTHPDGHAYAASYTHPHRDTHGNPYPHIYAYFDRHGNYHTYAMSATERNRLGLWFSRVRYRLGLVLRMLRG